MLPEKVYRDEKLLELLASKSDCDILVELKTMKKKKFKSADVGLKLDEKG